MFFFAVSFPFLSFRLIESHGPLTHSLTPLRAGCSPLIPFPFLSCPFPLIP